MTLATRLFVAAVSLLAFGGMTYYLYRRLVLDVTPSRPLRIAGAAALALLFLAVPLLRLGHRDALPDPTLAAALSSWWGLALYLLMWLLLVDAGLWVARRLLRRPGARRAPPTSPAEELVENPQRRLFVSRLVAAGASVASGGTVLTGIASAFERPEVTEVPIRLPGLPRALEGFTIVQLTDLHLGMVIQQRFLDQLVEVANAARPDLVAITGDLVDGSPALLGGLVARLRNLRSRAGTYFVSGNHDYYSGWERWAPVLESLGLTVLRNRRVRVGDAGASFELLGVDDFGTRYNEGGYDFQAASEGLDPARPSVLLAHQPVNLEEIAAHPIGLQLSGHTHGGQIFPGTLVGTAIWGDRNRGLSRVGRTHLYTSRGCGFVGPPMRLGSAPEVVKIVLLPA